QDLFENYYSHMSPYNTGTKSLNIFSHSNWSANSSSVQNEPPAEMHISLEYSHLTQVIEVQMTHTNVFGLHSIWRDPRLTWDPAQYGNIEYIYVRSSDVWIPEITPCESSVFSMTVADRFQKVKLNSTGHLDHFIYGYASFICEFSMQDFPFDQHWCFYCFALPDYSAKELVFRGYNGSEQLALSQDTSEWKLKMRGFRYRTTMANGIITQNMGEIYFDFLITRRPSFWVFLIIIPAYLLGFLILLGLFFGTEPNNVNMAVNFGLISFTSMTFIIGTIANTLPKSQNISILGWYIIFELLLITLAVFSVFLHGMICEAARKSYNWWTGERNSG
ncbi:hypothetical protein PENTCL1PPCAC_15722, partial [Pristionchus entomophagus]